MAECVTFRPIIIGSQTTNPNVKPIMKTSRKRGVRDSVRNSFSTIAPTGSGRNKEGRRNSFALHESCVMPAAERFVDCAACASKRRFDSNCQRPQKKKGAE